MNSDPASLQNLNDIVSPGPVAWWPLAPGWYVIAALLLALSVWALIRLNRQWSANAYRREAMRSFSAMRNGGEERARELPELLKRTALAAWPRRQVAALSGAEWHGFLDRTASTTLFSGGAGAILERLAYPGRDAGRLSEEEFQQLYEAIAHWLKNHRKGTV